MRLLYSTARRACLTASRASGPPIFRLSAATAGPPPLSLLRCFLCSAAAKASCSSSLLDFFKAPLGNAFLAVAWPLCFTCICTAGASATVLPCQQPPFQGMPMQSKQYPRVVFGSTGAAKGPHKRADPTCSHHVCFACAAVPGDQTTQSAHDGMSMQEEALHLFQPSHG